MTALISNIGIDCANAYELSARWKRILGFVDIEDDPDNPGDEECMVEAPTTGERILFLEVPGLDVSTPKRIHLDLRPVGRTRDEELDVLRGLGATDVADHLGIHGPGTGWVVLADPEGKQFCILRGEHEYAG